MNRNALYQHPPLIKAYLAHAICTALIGLFLSAINQLTWLQDLLVPVVNLVPNAIQITDRAPNPVFAKVFISASLLIAAIILLYFTFFVRGYHQKTFDNRMKRSLAILYGWLIAVVLLFIAWCVPYFNPASQGKTYYLLRAALGSDWGIVFVANQLLVGFPLLILLGIWSMHFCTGVLGKAPVR